MVIHFTENETAKAKAFVHTRSNSDKASVEVYREGDLYVADFSVELD